ncbi:glutathione S-transferase 1-like [Centruroides vittatus]|uniref:glutathione S-transferase 1-like n=1 Tax=Centruroides vittatus TaxID=120091 RepID=UPI00350EB33B
MGAVCTVPAQVTQAVDMPLVLYHFPVSSPCRAVIMTAKHLGIELSLKEINLFNKEQLKPEFLKINPQHSVPTLDDNGFILWESRAIMGYLVNKYAPGNSLYPEDPQKRAEVDKMLYFDIGNLYKKVLDFVFPQIFTGAKPDEEKRKILKDSTAILDEILSKSQYTAADHVTLADLSILAGIGFAEVMDIDFSEFKHIKNWKEKLEKELPYYKEVNEKALEDFKDYLKSRKQ